MLAISEDWSSDCRRDVPTFARIAAETGMELRIFNRDGQKFSAANVPSLMLSDEVIEAVRQGRFHVHAVRSIDEGIALLTGLPAGERGEGGRYPEGSVYRMAADRLAGYAERLRGFGESPNGAAPALHKVASVPSPTHGAD